MALRMGIDVGSTTVKVCVLSEDSEILYSCYERHFARVKECVLNQLSVVEQKFGGGEYRISITGSAGLGLAERSGLPFVQEVQAAFTAIRKFYPDADAAVELGGEDAKIIFITGGTEQRMNGSCAGGTGAFIDQMATLLNITVSEMDELSLRAEKVYPIASRCGVFAKSDIQPLLNQGARKEDISASIFQAVVDQTVAGLAQGRRIKGKVLFLGGPLYFIQGLRRAFKDTLKLDDDHAIFPENAPCFMGIGAALYAQAFDPVPIGEAVVGLEKLLNHPTGEYRRILICRPNAQFDDDIGFLPGDEQEKISPLMRPIIDNLEQLIDSSEEERYQDEEELKGKVDEIFARGIIQAEALNYIRGRSIVKTYLIIDEAQNTTPDQIKGIITRAGKDTKIILLGDPNQIDRPFLDERTNGLSYASEHMKGSPLCWQITMTAQECERSALAMEAVRRL